jgi:hypothetical protein
MPFPVLRESDDESGSDFEGIQEEKVVVAVENEDRSTKQKPVLNFVPISQEVYNANQDVIKAGLRGASVKIHFKFPAKGTIDAERFPASTEQNIFVLPDYKGDDTGLDNYDLNFPVEDFPSGFVGMFDASGRRWKCVAYWNGNEVKYIVNVAAEIRLCGNLFAGSTKGGKVRWDKAVVPNNLIPGKFGSFAVSDKVLLERRKSAWPAQLKQHQENCGISISENVPQEKRKGKDVTEKEKEKTKGKEKEPAVVKKQTLKTQKIPLLQVPEEPMAPKPVCRKMDFEDAAIEPLPKKRKTVDETYVEIKAGIMSTRFSSDDQIQIELVTEKDGLVTRTKLFCN